MGNWLSSLTSTMRQQQYDADDNDVMSDDKRFAVIPYNRIRTMFDLSCLLQQFPELKQPSVTYGMLDYPYFAEVAAQPYSVGELVNYLTTAGYQQVEVWQTEVNSFCVAEEGGVLCLICSSTGNCCGVPDDLLNNPRTFIIERSYPSTHRFAIATHDIERVNLQLLCCGWKISKLSVRGDSKYIIPAS